MEITHGLLVCDDTVHKPTTLYDKINFPLDEQLKKHIHQLYINCKWTVLAQ